MMLKNGTVDETFLDELMAKVRSRSASDLHLVPGCRPMQRIDGQLIEAGSFFYYRRYDGTVGKTNAFRRTAWSVAEK